jgi:hypothetical protein
MNRFSSLTMSVVLLVGCANFPPQEVRVVLSVGKVCNAALFYVDGSLTDVLFSDERHTLTVSEGANITARWRDVNTATGLCSKSFTEIETTAVEDFTLAVPQ